MFESHHIEALEHRIKELERRVEFVELEVRVMSASSDALAAAVSALSTAVDALIAKVVTPPPSDAPAEDAATAALTGLTEKINAALNPAPPTA